MVNMEALTAMASAKGYNIASLERAANLGNGVIGRWRTASPNLETLEKVAGVIGCSIADLVDSDRTPATQQ